MVFQIFSDPGKADGDPVLSPAQPGGDEKPGPAMGGRRRRAKGALGIGPTGRGRFKNAEPTIWRDEDLDVPTFIRKNLNLDF